MRWPKFLTWPFYDLLNAIRGVRLAQDSFNKSLQVQLSAIADDVHELKEVLAEVERAVKVIREKQ